MCLFKKKKLDTSKEIEKSHKKILENAAAAEVLVSLAKDNKELTKELKLLVDALKYLDPKVSSEVASLDNKISNALGDLKIILSKDTTPSDKIKDLIKKVNVLINERKAIVE